MFWWWWREGCLTCWSKIYHRSPIGLRCGHCERNSIWFIAFWDSNNDFQWAHRRGHYHWRRSGQDRRLVYPNYVEQCASRQHNRATNSYVALIYSGFSFNLRTVCPIAVRRPKTQDVKCKWGLWSVYRALLFIVIHCFSHTPEDDCLFSIKGGGYSGVLMKACLPEHINIMAGTCC